MPALTSEEQIKYLAERGFLSPGEVELVRSRYRHEHDGPLLAFLAKEKLLPQEVSKDLSILLADGRFEGLDPHLPGLMLLCLIGQGGRGNVFRAWQPSLKRVVAVKILSQELAGNREYIQRFLREARVASKVNHKQIVRAFDINKADGSVYLVMEYVNGQSVGEVLRRHGRIAPGPGLEIARQVAEAIAYASGVGLVHRDIKPDNIMLDRHGRVKLCDLGLARTINSSHLTAPMVAQGTPAYMSPEAATKPDVDSQTDVYSLGATLYRMLLGRLPFEHEDPIEVLRMHVEEEVRGLESGEVPGAVSDLIRRMMDKDPKKRPQAKVLPGEITALAKAIPGLDHPKLWKLVERGEPPPVVPTSASAVQQPTEQIPEGLTRADEPPPRAPTRVLPVGQPVPPPAANSRTVLFSFAAMAAALLICLIYIVATSLSAPQVPPQDPEINALRTKLTDALKQAEANSAARKALGDLMVEAANRLREEDTMDAALGAAAPRAERVEDVMRELALLRRMQELRKLPGD